MAALLKHMARREIMAAPPAPQTSGILFDDLTFHVILLFMLFFILILLIVSIQEAALGG